MEHFGVQMEKPQSSRGGFGPVGFLISLIITLVAAGILGAAYAYLNSLIPFIYVNVILMFLFGGAVGFVAQASAAMTKLESGFGIGLVAVIASVIGVYFAWVAHLHAVYESNVWLLGTIIRRASQIAETGPWTVSDFTPTGIIAWGLWGLEALMIVGSSLYAVVNLRKGAAGA